jgi:hypothetical protein
MSNQKLAKSITNYSKHYYEDTKSKNLIIDLDEEKPILIKNQPEYKPDLMGEAVTPPQVRGGNNIANRYYIIIERNYHKLVTDGNVLLPPLFTLTGREIG